MVTVKKKIEAPHPLESLYYRNIARDQLTTSVSSNQREDMDLEEFLLQWNGFLPKISTNFYWWYNVWFSSHYVIMCVRVSVTIIVKKKYWTGTVREKSVLSGKQREIRDRYLEMGKRESKVKNQTGELFLEWNFKNRVRYWSDSEEKLQKREIRKWRIGSRKPEVPTCT